VSDGVLDPARTAFFRAFGYDPRRVVAIFRSTGPKDDSAAGFFVHFRDQHDWIVHRPEEDR
jgi:hypothetical protein